MKQKTELEKKYSETSNEIDMLLNSIKAKLKKQAKSFAEHSTDWGYLGNLGKVREELTNLDEFLK
jgi:hypothetical protein